MADTTPGDGSGTLDPDDLDDVAGGAFHTEVESSLEIGKGTGSTCSGAGTGKLTLVGISEACLTTE